MSKKEIKLFGKILSIRDSTDSLPALQSDEAWQKYLAGKGYSVSASTALKVAAVYRCVDVVSKTMASLPAHLYIRTDRGGEKAENHPIDKLLYRLPNRETTAYEFWQMYVANLMMTRGAFARISRDGTGHIAALWNIPTANCGKIKHNTVTGERYFTVTADDGKTETLYDGQFMFTPGFRISNENDPEDPINIASDVLGLTTALNRYANDYFSNGTNPGAVIECPEDLNDEAYERFKESWYQSYAGALNQFKTVFLESGAKYTAVGRNPEESQSLESRQFAIAEVCRIWGIPPHKVFDLSNATFSNIEHLNIEYVQESIGPMAVRIEQTIYKDLLTTDDQRKYYAKFNVNALLRGDSAARSAYYHNARQDGWMNANDIRELEDMNKIPAADGGDVYAVNGNMIPLTAIPQNLPKGAIKNA